MKKKMLMIAAILLLCAAGTALGYYGNIIYPSFSGYKPSKPFSKEQWEIDSYRKKVEEYVEDCEQYVHNAEDDIRTIEKAIESALADGNDVVEEYNRFLRYGF